MKSLSVKIYVILIVMAISFANCKKEEQQSSNKGPAVLSVSKGFLATMGINSINVLDTLGFIYYPGAPSLHDYSYNWPIYSSPKDVWYVGSDGATGWTFRNNGGKYLGVHYNPFLQGLLKYSLLQYDTPGDNTSFLKNKIVDDKFYITPALYPNLYLKTMSPVDGNGQPGPAGQHRDYRFVEGTSQQQLWFFVNR